MLSCLINRIGILGCDAPSSAAVIADPDAMPPIAAVDALPVLFINDLPGCSLTKIDSLTNDERDTYLEVWNKIALRATYKFVTLVKAQFNKCFRITDQSILACLICEHAGLFDVALWYLHGTELMIEITSTDNLNRYTTIDLEKAEKLKEEFYTEFSVALKDAVSSINPQDSDCLEDECIECNDAVKWVFQTP